MAPGDRLQDGCARFAVARVLAALTLALCILACALPIRAVYAATANIELSETDPTANVPFAVEGMLPGDAESLTVRVDVEHAGSDTVCFKVENLEQTKNLAEALEVSVTDCETGAVIAQATAEELAQGRAIEIPVESGAADSADSKANTALNWVITATLPTSVGNEYQSASCSFDLVWSIRAEEEPGPAVPVEPGGSGSTGAGGIMDFIAGLLPRTGDSAFWLLLFVALCLGAVAMFRSANRLAKEKVSGGGSSEGEGPAVAIGADAPASTGRESVTTWLNRHKPLVALLLGIVLMLAAATLAWALFWAQARLPHNTFQTGTVSIDLNGGEPVFGEGIEMEPGRTLVEDFTVTNTGSASCYYRVRLENLHGELAPALDVTIKRGDEVLFRGSAIDLELSAATCTAALEPNATDTLTAIVTMDEASGNSYQGAEVTFDVVADATQVRNNEGRQFE